MYFLNDLKFSLGTKENPDRKLVMKCALLARMLHQGQYRKDGKTPYFHHVRDVALNVYKRQNSSPNMLSKDFYVQALCAAFLHDTIEDTKADEQYLLDKDIPQEIVDIVKLLTKKKGQSYESYLSRLRPYNVARFVKICDILHNLGDNPSDRQIKKYTHALQYLTFETDIVYGSETSLSSQV
jgi:(p)ppGpp synthase/HD superfamily hydrolase